MTQQTGLLGFPVQHSLSPALHNAVYQQLDLDWCYRLYPCRKLEDFQTALASLRELGEDFVGVNVTTPWKQAAFAAADSCRDRVTEIVHAANVLIHEHKNKDTQSKASRLLCTNADGRGIVAAVQRLGFTFSGARVLICGTGAVAGVAAVEAIYRQAATVTLLSRELTRASQLAQYLKGQCPAAKTELQALEHAQSDQLQEATSQATVIISATTPDAEPPGVLSQALHDGQLVMDVNYGRGPSYLLGQAVRQGAQALDGLEMLIEQAALTIEFWAAAQGQALSVSRDLMRAVADRQSRQARNDIGSE